MQREGTGRRVLSYVGERWSGFFLILLLVGFGLMGRNFFAVKNFSNILYYATIYLLLAGGETYVIITGGIDLSVGFVMGLVMVVSAIIMRDMHAAGAAPVRAVTVASTHATRPSSAQMAALASATRSRLRRYTTLHPADMAKASTVIQATGRCG